MKEIKKELQKDVDEGRLIQTMLSKDGEISLTNLVVSLVDYNLIEIQTIFLHGTAIFARRADNEVCRKDITVGIDEWQSLFKALGEVDEKIKRLMEIRDKDK